ncbi:hypothetical protein CFC21_025867 [Triticum aestivum]|uniref:Uncharacterized protein n=2 Tax=Triticum aestivum TaxID=4565 RepID=A0A9R1EKU2_WHEAT|nr:uncharacterized protein LOC119368532 [Triticum dicoccoides]XP_044320749.1 uncharacterized protein LOC123042340 [Triticum aestivum]KAF7011582.1 hypothetical protein CFC21_025867 [Triticum aestivum]
MGRQRRWSRAALLACLLLLAAACAESARPGPLAAASEGLPRGASVSADDSGGDGPRRSAFDVLVEGLVSIGLGRRWRAGDGVGLVDGDKRRVPTGPNPLHNR